jgi:hypothetical protein
MTDQAMTVGEFKRRLAVLKDSDKIYLPGKLTFYRIKQRGENEFHIEVNEPEGYLSDKFKKRNSSVKVVFLSTDDVEWDETGMIGGPIDPTVR